MSILLGKEVVAIIFGTSFELGIHGVYVNSSIVDEGALVKQVSVRLRADSFQLYSIELIQGF